MRFQTLVLFALLGAAACGPSDVPASDAALTRTEQRSVSYPVVTFHDDWTVTSSAPLVAGQPALLRYESNRAPCHGLNWDIIASVRSENSHRHDLSLEPTVAGDAREMYFTVPFGNDVRFWFYGWDDNGCQGYDSNYGSNWQVAVQNPVPSIHFRPDWSIVTSGSLSAGGPIHIDFDLWRTPFCNAVTMYDTFTGDSVMYYRFDGGPTQSVSLLQNPEGIPGTINNQSGRTQVAPVIQAPANASELEVWFLGSHPADTYNAACTNWDSNHGANYRFALTQ
ncbi:DUF6209 family protein [Pyxidicoccus sp. 3LFB2]